MTPVRPVFRRLSPRECRTVLARNVIGRMAFTLRRAVDIEPVHLVLDGDWLYGRTSEGTKIHALAHRPWVAVEVDEVDGPFDWFSVVVHGTFWTLPEDGSPLERTARRHAIDLFEKVVPGTATPDDPTPHRTIWFRIAISDMTGRAATTVRRAGRRNGRPPRARVAARFPPRSRQRRGVSSGGAFW